MDESNLPDSIGEWIRLRRRVLDLTQTELAQRVGCSVFALRKIESGERRPSKQLARLLANSLEIPQEDHPIFIRVARGELNFERLRPPPAAPASRQAPALNPVTTYNNLPVAPTPLVGREPELAALSQLLRDPDCRLLTLTGPGGIGKTRLAIEVASRNRDRFSSGACFVELAPVNSISLLTSTIANALGFNFQGQIDLHDQLLNHLRPQQALLVLDNFEHLLDGVGLLAEISGCAAGVKLLVTSRERLNLQGEWVFETQGLPVPPNNQVGSVEEYSSVALFVQSARRAQAGFELRKEDRPWAVRICQMLEGMPLGIELAAAWVSVLTCREIAQEIESSLDFLATSMRDVPSRQRSLHAAFDHSWSLLTPDERRMLSRLAIFQGGFKREAAELVAGATLPSLLALASKSLVRRSESGRFDLHEVVRQYALSHLVEDPQCEAARDRHCEFYLAMLRDREKDLQGHAQHKAIGELKDEINNVRAAWIWGVKRDKFLAIGQALRSFALLFDLGGLLPQGTDLLDLVVQTIRARPVDEAGQKVLGQVLTQQGDLLFRQGHFIQALDRLEESLSILRPFGDPALLVGPLIFSATIRQLNGDFSQAQMLGEEGMACAQAAGDEWFTAYAHFTQGRLASQLGRLAEGYEQMLTGVAKWRALGDQRYTALGLNFTYDTAIYLGYYKEAQAFMQESIELCTKVGDRWGLGTAYRNLGLAALTQGNFVEAQSHIEKSLDFFSEMTTGWDFVLSFIYLGEAKLAVGDTEKARHLFVDALRLGIEVQVITLALDAVMGLASLQARAGKAEEALELSYYVLNHAASAQLTKERAAKLILEAEAQLAVEQVQAARERSQNQSLEAILSTFLKD